MSEDYTYPTTPTLADLRTRVAELERENAELRERQSAQFERSTARLVDVALDAERQAQRVAELERENAELRGKLDAVPVGAISAIAADAIADAWNRKPLQSVNAWLKTQVQP